MIREKHIPISGWLLSQLRTFSELHGLACAEDALEMIVRERFDKEPALQDLAKRIDASRKAAFAEWRKANNIET